MVRRSVWRKFFLGRKWISPRQWHFLLMTAILFLCVNFQSFFSARASNPWLHLDLVSVLVVYFSIEHFLGAAFVKVTLAAFIMQATSLAPAGFFLMYFWIALVIANIMAKYVVLHNVFNQLFIFSAIFSAKFLLLYIVAAKLGLPSGAGDFFYANLPQFVSTVLVSVPIFALMARIDSSFEFAATRDRRAELVEGF